MLYTCMYKERSNKNGRGIVDLPNVYHQSKAVVFKVRQAI